MRPIYVMALIGLLIVFGLAGVRQAQLQRRLNEAQEMTDKTAIDAAYNRGFMEGINATTKHIQFNTNTGRFTLELTNVLAEMRP